MNTPEGHRERLRQRFLIHPEALTEAERLELLIGRLPKKSEE